ncbi:hypothetical protein L2E82_32828 [Cichorium intybus]|uniref:Uncharacterized protein n=1 Tax=Cichorium intybus TaxID=13427 RepID=A0ACB9BJ43_CICIN|nr:hypothetical protein L2E82_32828 [Cichorium intybus]
MPGTRRVMLINFKSNVYCHIQNSFKQLPFQQLTFNLFIMSIDQLFETLVPSRIIIFTTPNPVNHRCYLRTPRVRVAVLDSPVDDDAPQKIAAMIVPEQRETDWNFCTDTGHLQLLSNYPGLSRLILIGNNLPPNSLPCIYIRPPDTDTDDRKKLEEELQPLFISLHPKACLQNGLPKTRFVTYEDDLLYRKIIARFVGPFVGEFVVEDVLLESDEDSVGDLLRRRLRFKRMPSLIQSEVLLYPKIDGEIVTAVLNLENFMKMKNAKFYVDTTVLVHPYLTPMVSGLFLIASHLNERIQQGFTPRALCLGVGGGSLLSFLNTELGFEVTGVEVDEVVLTAATQHFGLLLGDHGVLIMNVVPLDNVFYTKLIQKLKDVFQKVYEIDVEDEENYVFMATVSPTFFNDDVCDLFEKLRSVIPEDYIESMIEL